MHYSFKQIVDSLPKKKNSNSSLWVKIIIRKISFPFTFLFINLGFSANSVSVLSIFTAIAACVCFMVPIKTAMIVAIILTQMWLVLDCVDGNIARVKKRKNSFGEFIDDVGGYYIEALIYFAIGVCTFHFGGVLFTSGDYLLIIMGAGSSIVNILARLIYKDYCHFADHADMSMQEQHTVDDKKSLYYIRNRVSKELGISGLFMPAIIFCAVFLCFDLLTLFYLIFNAFALISTTVIYIYKGNKFDREKKD